MTDDAQLIESVDELRAGDKIIREDGRTITVVEQLAIEKIAVELSWIESTAHNPHRMDQQELQDAIEQDNVTVEVNDD